METCEEWCPNCQQEVKLPYERKYHKCPSCGEPIAPCAQFSHGEEENSDLPLCICLGE
jgi:predicted RNA-binding Zn-ribbon protein involved in translation (DUF1610 family)